MSAKVVFAVHCIGKRVGEIGIRVEEGGWGVKQKLKLTGQTLLTLFCIPRKGFITITLSVISTKTWLKKIKLLPFEEEGRLVPAI